MKRNLENLDRHRSLRKNLSVKQYVDAFHFWRAEVSGIDYFLSPDKKFVNAMRQTKKVQLDCHSFFPSE
ncbi:hypothetical protein TDB9533_04375 [Thalassocella blandensis]|nr:hypothetical protein TDB9533_04375 [Thalassocella blandensis]